MQSFDGERCHLLQIIQHLTVTHRQTLKDATCHRPVILRHRLTRLLAIVPYRFHHAGRVGKLRRIREDEALECWCRHAVLADLPHIGRSIRPFLPATLQEPHATNVLQKTGRTLDAPFVREVILKTLIADDGLLRLDTQERPRAATQIGEPFILSRHGSHSGTRIMASHRHDGNGSHPRQSLHLLRQPTHLLTRVHITAKLTLLQSQHSDEFRVNPMGARVKELARRENRVFTHRFPRQHITQCIGDEQNLVSRLQRRIMIPLQRRELEKRVERHKLDARLLIDPLLRHQLEVLLHRPIRMGVTIAIGIAQHSPILPNHHHIHTPRVDAD